MHLYRGLHNCTVDGRGAAVAIGNFDGVHLGHQALVHAARERAQADGAALAVLTFEPHPREYLDPAAAPPRLMRVGEKCAALAALGVERLIVLRFDARLQHLSPEAFIDSVLRNGLGARHVVVGEGFRFGCRRAGSIDTLARAGPAAGFEVALIPHTLSATTLGPERIGDRVNLEVDLVAKYIEALIAPYQAPREAQ